MKRLLMAVTGTLFVIMGSQTASAQNARGVSETLESRVANTYIVRLDADLSPQDVRGRARDASSRFSGDVTHVYTGGYRGFAIRLSPVQASRLIADPALGAVSVVRDRVVTLPPNEQGFGANAKPENPGGGNGGGGGKGGGKGGGGGGGGEPTTCAQETPWGVTRVTGLYDYECATTTNLASSGLRACVLDTGIDLDHPDLNVNAAESVSFVFQESDPNDLHGHGTHVGGTIGAIANTLGVIGVAPGVELVAIKVLNRQGSGSLADVISGVNATTALGCDVANLSLGDSTASEALDELSSAIRAVAYPAPGADPVIFTLAAGNSSANTNYYTPAKASRLTGDPGQGTTSDHVLTIASVGPYFDVWSSFSNYQGTVGEADVDFAQPGEMILSTFLDGQYAIASGTSMAAPHAAGQVINYLNAGISNYNVDGCAVYPNAAGVKNYPILTANGGFPCVDN